MLRNVRDTLTALLLLLSLTGAVAEAQMPEILRDINPVPYDLEPANLHDTGTLIYFSGDDGKHGRELWRSDGTPEGTFLVQDINPAFLGPVPRGSDPTGFVTLNGTTYFCAFTNERRVQLYSTRGGKGDVVSLTAGNPQLADGLIDCPGIVTSAGKLLLSGGSPATGVELVEFDPADNSVTVYDLDRDTGGTAASSYPRVLGEVKEGMYLLSLHRVFAGKDWGQEPWLWLDDSKQVFPVGDLNQTIISGSNTFGSGPNRAVRGPDGLLYFLATTNGALGQQVYRLNPRASFSYDAKVVSGEYRSSFQLVADEHRIYFDGQIGGPGIPREVFSWAPGEVEATSLNLALASSSPRPELFTVVDGILVFSADRGAENGGWELYRATKAGFKVFDIRLGSLSSDPSYVGRIGKTVYFAATSDGEGQELWRYVPDTGTNTPQLVADFNPGQRNFLAFTSDSTWFKGVQAGRVVVHGVKDGQNGIYVYQPGGSTSLFADLSLADGRSQSGQVTGPVHLSPATFLFGGFDPENGQALWKSDGTAAGTTVVKSGVRVRDLTHVSGTPFFVFHGQEETYGSELWGTDGTAGGTRLLKDINPGRLPSSPSNFVASESLVFFIALSRLWRTDGTPEGTIQLDSPRPVSEHGMVRLADGVLFVHNTIDRELWFTDGTEAGTKRVKDLNPLGSDLVGNLFEFDGAAFFAGRDSDSGVELWITDGTAAGTRLVADICPGAGGSNPTNFLEFRGRLYFSAACIEGVPDRRIYSFNGFTVREEIDPTPSTNRDGGWISLKAMSDSLFYIGEGQDGALAALYRSDGTQGGAEFVTNVGSSADVFLRESREVGPITYFVINDDWRTGDSLWRTDGTTPGTKLVSDGFRQPLEPDTTRVNGLLDIAGQLYFAADDPFLGRELFVLRDECPEQPEEYSAGACGCGIPNTDADGDGTPDCADLCPADPAKVAPGACGCGTPDVDSDGDGAPDCVDACPADSGKTVAGACGCGIPDVDTDGDGVFDCQEACPFDPGKTDPGVCGCGVPDVDADQSGILDCLVTDEFRLSVTDLFNAVHALRPVKEGQPKKRRRAANAKKRAAKALLEQFQSKIAAHGLQIDLATSGADLNQLAAKVEKGVKKSLRLKNRRFKKNKRQAKAAIWELEAALGRG